MEKIPMTQLQIKQMSKVQTISTLALFLGITLIIGFIERSIPLDFAIPGVRLGLSNVIILTLLYLYKPSQVFCVVLLKCLLTAAFAGTPISLLYSLSGSLLSYTVMLVLVKAPFMKLSPVGVSVAGAIFHNLGQIVAAIFVLGTPKIVFALPILLVSGVITGILVGIASNQLLVHFSKLGS